MIESPVRPDADSDSARAALASAALRALDLAPEGFMLLAPVWSGETRALVDLEYRYVNASAGQILGRSPEEFVGRRLGEVYPGVRDTGLLARYLRVFETHAVESFDLPYDRDGLARCFRVTVRRTDDFFSLTFTDQTESKRLEAEALEQSALNETLVRTGEALGGELDLETIVQRLTDEATKICRAQFGAFFYNTTNEAGDAFLLYTLSGAPREAFGSFPLPRATPLFGVTFRGEGVLRLDNVREDPRFGAWGRQPAGHLPVVSYLAVPVLSRNGAVLGGLFFGHAEPGVFTARDERILVAVAAQAAVAIDNARLYREATRARDAEARRARHAALQGEVGSALAAGGDLREVLQQTARAIVDKLETAFARIWTVDDAAGEYLQLQASAGTSTHLDGPHARVRVGELEIGRIASERRPHLTNDVQHDPAIDDHAWARREGFVAFAGYPLVVADRVVGVVATFARQPLGEDTLAALRSVVDTIGLSVERHRADAERERYRAEAQAQRDRLQRVFACAPVGVAVLRGPEHVYDLTNAPYRALISGRPVEGKPIRAAFPEFEGQGIYELLDGVYKSGERFVGNGIPVRLERGGETVEGYFNFVYEPMLDVDGTVEGIVVVAVEVTDQVIARQRAEALADNLRSSEERFRSLVTATSQIVFTAASNGSREEDAAAWREFTGRTFEQWRGDAWLGAVHRDDEARVRAAWRRAIDERAPYESEYRLRRRDGAYRTVHARAIAVRNADGSTREWVGTITDVTEERAAAAHMKFLAASGKALAGSLDYDVTLRAAARMMVPAFADWCWVDVLDDGAVVRRVEIVHADPAHAPLAKALATFPADLKLRHPAAEVLASGRALLIPEVHDELLGGATQSPEHLDLLRSMRLRSGVLVPLSIHGSVRAILFIVAVGDSRHDYGQVELQIAEEIGRRISVALEASFLFAAAQAERTRAEQANRAKDEFLAMMSHELRTPLNAMLGWVRLLRTGSLPEEKRARALETIERNARAQAQLVDDVLDVSRIITGKLRLNVMSVNVLQLVETAMETARPTAEAKGVQLDASLEPDVGVVTGDPDRLQQVFWNLLANAVKFTPKGGRVHVLVRRDESYVDVVVEDTGKGIGAEFLPYVFERFRQADGSITRVHGGLGLGLAIVKHLVELHGGTVQAHSGGEGKGATFVVRVPIAPRQHATSAPSVTPRPAQLVERVAAPSTLAGLRVLVLDDEGDARELLDTVLKQCGAEVDTAASVAAALGLVRARRYDVIVSDIGLPSEDGYTFIRAVRGLDAEHGGATPAVALTAYARIEDRTRALLAGFQSHVAKPVDPAALLAVIADVARR